MWGSAPEAPEATMLSHVRIFDFSGHPTPDHGQVVLVSPDRKNGTKKMISRRRTCSGEVLYD